MADVDAAARLAVNWRANGGPAMAWKKKWESEFLEYAQNEAPSAEPNVFGPPVEGFFERQSRLTKARRQLIFDLHLFCSIRHIAEYFGTASSNIRSLMKKEQRCVQRESSHRLWDFRDGVDAED